MRRGLSAAFRLVASLSLLLAGCGAHAPAAKKALAASRSTHEHVVRHRPLSSFARFAGTATRTDVCLPTGTLEGGISTPAEIVDCWSGAVGGHGFQLATATSSGDWWYQLTIAGMAPVVGHAGYPGDVYQFSGSYACIAGAHGRIAINLESGATYTASPDAAATQIARKNCASPQNSGITALPYNVAGIPGSYSIVENLAPTLLFKPAAPIETVAMSSLKTGWVLLQGGQVFHTGTGGATWQYVTPKPLQQATNVSFWGAFPDAQHAFLVGGAMGSYGFIGAPVVYATSDGGRTWSRYAIGGAGSPDSATAQFLTDSLGYILFTYGGGGGSEEVTILRTTDGGRDWSVLAAGMPQGPIMTLLGGDKSGFAFMDAAHGWMTGHTNGPGILLYRSTDGGSSWSYVSPPLPSPVALFSGSGVAESFPPVFFTGGLGVLPVAFSLPHPAAVFYRTADGGQTWIPTTPVGSGMLAWAFPTPEVGYSTDGHALHRTADGGATWTTLTPALGLEDVTQIDFVSASIGWAVVGGSLFRTLDGGATWSPINVGHVPLFNG